MAGLFFSRSDKSGIKHHIAIDIGSNTAIRSLLFDRSETDCIALKKQYFELPQRDDELDLITPLSEYLRRLVFQYVKEAGRLPHETLIGLGSHFTFNEVTTERVERKRPRETIRPQELRAVLNDYLERHRTKVIDRAPYALVHLMPFRITVDGYRLDILGPTTAGRTLEINLFATYALDSYWEALWHLKSLWGGLNLGFISNQDAIAQALVSVLGVHDALIIKIGAKITEVSILGDGVILFTGQFTLAGDNFTQAVARRLGIERAEAEKIKQQSAGEFTLPPKTAQAVNEAVAATIDLWVAELVKLLKSQERFTLPEHVFLLGGGSRLAPLLETLKTRPWFEDLTFLKGLNVKSLRAEDLTASVFRNVTSPLNGPEEVALAALVLKAAVGRKVIHRAKAEKYPLPQAATNIEKIA